MVVDDELVVWLYGLPVATIGQERGRVRLTYGIAALRRYPLGTPLLSLSMPVRPERYTHGTVRPFLDGLLPEGEPRRAAALDVKVSADDTYGLIRALGRDCAGAMVIHPASESPPPVSTTLTAQRLDEDDVVDLVRNLRGAPLGISERVRLSLAGVQEKLLLTRLPDGTWGRPVDGTPSTHILKPELQRFRHSVENEAFCMRFAGRLGLPVASVETTTLGSHHLLVVERYDRIAHPDGSVQRVHQEDFCQATGTPPDNKYQENGGPSLQQIAGIVQDAVPARDALEQLLRLTICNVLIGNGDAHGKNLSLLHTESGALALSPAYDLLSTLFYGDQRLAMYIDSVQRMDRVTFDRIAAEASRWGLPAHRVAHVIDDVVARSPSARTEAAAETPGVPSEIPQIVSDQLDRMMGARASRHW